MAPMKAVGANPGPWRHWAQVVGRGLTTRYPSRGARMQKIDLKKELKHLYQPSAEKVVQVDVPTMNYLMVDGEGDPNTSQADDMSVFTSGDKSSWKWTAMIMQPDFVTRGMIDIAIADVRKKKNPAAISIVRFEPLSEGTCAQILHVGPFSEEGPTIAKVHAFIDARGTRVGKHHETYVSDIRRADPSKWKTIVRQPMR
jgi:hypothetical protein